MSSVKPAARLNAIDALRGVAVLAVLVSHLPFSTTTTPAAQLSGKPESVFPEWLDQTLDHGRFGVHLFLVISGFCIHMAWARRNDDAAEVSFLSFWKRRLHRLYPPYFVALLMSLGGLFVLHGVLGHASGGIAARLGYPSTTQLAIDLVLLVLLAQNLNGASGRIGNGPFWTLALEEQLYALYFPLLWMRKKLGWTKALVVVGAVTLLWRTFATLFIPPESELLRTMILVGPARWFEWTLGAVAVEAYLGRVTLPAWCRSPFAALGLLAAGVLAFNITWFGLSFSYVVPFCDSLFGVGLFIMVNWACHIRWGDGRAGVVTRFFGWVGTFSYSLYLTHQPVIVAAKQIGFRLGLGAPGVLVLRLVLPIAAGLLFFQIVERRFLNSSRKTASSTSADEQTDGKGAAAATRAA
ncbi:MAG: acyltransferase [Rubrivivax sp.]